MKKYFSYLNTAEKLLSGYAGEIPFAIHAREYFSREKKFGSRDRKWISHLCYCYFRLGHTARTMPVGDRILSGLFLCTSDPNQLLEFIRPEWNERVALSIPEKFIYLRETGLDLRLEEVFPVLPFSDGVEAEPFIASHFKQPDLFIRVRPGFENIVPSKLAAAGIPYKEIPPRSIAIANAVPLQDVILLDKEAVVQDLSSQRTWDLLPGVGKGGKVWDCCAASGGKSFMVKDKLGNLELTVSDIRESVLANLRKRFSVAGLSNYQVVHKDLTLPTGIDSQFVLVIADVPCTGSGTWSRSPEQLYYFQETSLQNFSQLQKKICGNVIPAITPGGYFLYITCSVFRAENEFVIEFLRSNFGLKYIQGGIIAGYREKADTMYGCLLQRS